MAKRENIIHAYEQATQRLFADRAAFAEFLGFSGRFYKMPSSQVIMLFDDNPKATMVADYDTWKKFGRRLKPGGWSTDVLENGKVKQLFDISMTRSENPPPYQWTLDKQTAEEFVNQFSQENNYEFAGMTACINYIADKAVESRIEDVLSSLGISEEDEIKFTRSFNSMVRRVIAARCEWKSDFTYGGKPNGVDISALDLLESSDEMETLLEQVQITANAELRSMEHSINNIVNERKMNYERNENADRARDEGIGRGGSSSVVRGGEDFSAVDSDAQRENVPSGREDVSVQSDYGADFDERGTGADEQSYQPLGERMADVYDGEFSGGHSEAAGQNVVGADSEENRPGSVGDLGENAGGISNGESAPDNRERDSVGGAAAVTYERADNGHSGERSQDSTVSPENKGTTEENSPVVSFSEQVDAVLSGNASRYNDIKVCDTPEILLKAGLQQLPMLYTQRHLKEAIKPKDGHTHAHGLSIDQIKKMPQLLSDPVMMYDSLSRKDSIVVLTSELDVDNAPIIASIKPNGTGKYEMETLDSNFITSYYGKESFEKHISKVIDSGNLIYWNKQKSQELFSVLGLQSSKGLNNLDPNIIIHQSRNIVNPFSEKISENSQEISENVSQSDFSHSVTHDLPKIPSDLDKFYIDREFEVVTQVYYNPDSTEGGQLVYNQFTFDQIFDAMTKEDALDYLAAVCRQNLVDITAYDFEEKAREFLADTEDFNSRDEGYLDKLGALTEPYYSIIQLNDSENLRDYRFAPMDELREKGLYVDRENYSRVYRGRLQSNETLEDIFTKFNTQIPEDFDGHSLSVGDIIGIARDGKSIAYYVDSVGFEEIPDFLLDLEERRARRTLTDNIDLYAENMLASDEMDNLGDYLFATDCKYGHDGWTIGDNNFPFAELHKLAEKYKNGEDIRAELGRGMYALRGEISYYGKYGYDFPNPKIAVTRDENGMAFGTQGGFEISYSWEQLGEAMIFAARKEYARHEMWDRACEISEIINAVREGKPAKISENHEEQGGIIENARKPKFDNITLQFDNERGGFYLTADTPNQSGAVITVFPLGDRAVADYLYKDVDLEKTAELNGIEFRYIIDEKISDDVLKVTGEEYQRMDEQGFDVSQMTHKIENLKNQSTDTYSTKTTEEISPAVYFSEKSFAKQVDDVLEGKANHLSSITAYRIGDFYEFYGTEAQLTSEVLNLTQTTRQGVPMTGIPAHALEDYKNRLAEKGYTLQIGDSRDVEKILNPENQNADTYSTISESTESEQFTLFDLEDSAPGKPEKKIEIDADKNPELAKAIDALKDYAGSTILYYDSGIREAFLNSTRADFNREVERAISHAVTEFSRGELTSESAEKEDFSALYEEMFADREFAENLYSEISDMLYAEHTEIDKARQFAHENGIPYDEYPYDPEENFDPYAYDPNRMSDEDYDRMHDLIDAERAEAEKLIGAHIRIDGVDYRVDGIAPNGADGFLAELRAENGAELTERVDIVREMLEKAKSRKIPVPTITCEWSESSAFEDGKTYSVAEFDRIMKQADDEHVASGEGGYHKTKFTVNMPDGTTYTERQDIGDGYGGVIDFLSQYPKYTDVIPLLKEAIAEEMYELMDEKRAEAEYLIGKTVQIDDRTYEIVNIGADGAFARLRDIWNDPHGKETVLEEVNSVKTAYERQRQKEIEDAIEIKIPFTENGILRRFLDEHYPDNNPPFALANAMLKYLDEKFNAENEPGYDKLPCTGFWTTVRRTSDMMIGLILAMGIRSWSISSISTSM